MPLTPATPIHSVWRRGPSIRSGGLAVAFLAALLAAPLSAQQAGQVMSVPDTAALMAPPPQTADSVSLDQAVKLALEYSPNMAQSMASVSDARWGQRAAIGNFLPQLSVGSGASMSSQQRYNSATGTFLSGSSDSYNGSLSLSLPIFSGGRRIAQLRQANAQSDAASATLVQQRFAVTLSAKQAYYNVVQGEELIRVAKTSLEQANEGLTAAQQRAKVGSATQADVLTAQLQVSQAQASLLSARNTLINAEWALGRLVGKSSPVAVRDTRLGDPTPLSMSDSAIVQDVVHGAPTVVAAKATSKANDASLLAAKTQYLPSINFGSGYDWVNQNMALSNGQTSWNLRLSLSYPLFNGFVREQNVAQANAAADVARTQYADARRFALSQVHNLLNTLHLDDQQVQIAKQSVAVAQKNLQMQIERYSVSAATILDRITAQLSLVQAETNLVTARYNYQLARAQLDALVGREL